MADRREPRPHLARRAGRSPLLPRKRQRIFFQLRTTASERPQWNAFADAIRASAERLRQVYGAAQVAGQPATAPAQTQRRIAALSLLTETIRAVAAATRRLYAALPDEQERTADELLAERSQDMRRRGA